MRKLILVLILVLIATPAFAGLPTGKAGVYFSLRDHALNHTETIELIKIKDMFSLIGGYAGDSDSSDHKLVLGIATDLTQLKLGNYIKIPVLDLIEFQPAVFVGAGDINMQALTNSRVDYGIGAVLISVKF